MLDSLGQRPMASRSIDPAGIVLAMEAELATHGRLTGERARLLLAALRRVAAGDADTIDAALGFAGPSRPAYRVGRGRIIRDALIIGVARSLPLPPGASVWARAEAAARALRRFGSDTWPRWRTLDLPPLTAAGTWRAVAFHLYRDAETAGLPVPSSARSIYRLLARRH